MLIFIIWRKAADPEMQEIVKITKYKKVVPQMTNKTIKIDSKAPKKDLSYK